MDACPVAWPLELLLELEKLKLLLETMFDRLVILAVGRGSSCSLL